MKIDFRNLILTNLEGNTLPLDCSKQVANYIYNETLSLEDLILALDIYKNGEVDLTNEQIEKIRTFLKKGFKAFVQKAFEDTLEQDKSNIKSDKG